MPGLLSVASVGLCARRQLITHESSATPTHTPSTRPGPTAWAPQRDAAAASFLGHPKKVILSVCPRPAGGVGAVAGSRGKGSCRGSRRRHTRRGRGGGRARRGSPPCYGTRSLSDKVAEACVGRRRGATADTAGWANTEPAAADTRLNMTRPPPWPSSGWRDGAAGVTRPSPPRQQPVVPSVPRHVPRGRRQARRTPPLTAQLPRALTLIWPREWRE